MLINGLMKYTQYQLILNHLVKNVKMPAELMILKALIIQLYGWNLSVFKPEFSVLNDNFHVTYDIVTFDQSKYIP
jgi:hypothetical protein